MTCPYCFAEMVVLAPGWYLCRAPSNAGHTCGTTVAIFAGERSRNVEPA